MTARNPPPDPKMGDPALQMERDRRVAELWRRLDAQGTHELDLKGLKKGLRRIDHPMQNADDMLKQIIAMVDSNGDGKIQYEEFRVFVETAERQLLLLFRSIDGDHDGRISKDELRTALLRTGVAVPLRRLSGFFDEIDSDHDGYISFDEWRDFLLFIPATDSGSRLQTALSYYASIVVLNAEGDSMVSDETLEGLGTAGFLLQALFGSIVKIAQPAERPAVAGVPPPLPPPDPQTGAARGDGDADLDFDDLDADELELDGLQLDGLDDSSEAKLERGRSPARVKRTRLTEYLPHPGYFLAGALAGGISRTATAPFDRLKVYLLVNTHAASHASIDAARHGHPLAALHSAGRPISEAVRSLYRAGGLRTFFAGNGLNVVKIMPETAIKFGSYEAAKRTCAILEGHGDATRINPYSKFLAGGVAGMVAQMSVYPLDTLKFRLQCETVAGGPTGRVLLVQTAQRMWATGGVRAAYRGLAMGLAGMFPYSAIDMGTFELLKTTFTRYKARYYNLQESDDEAAPGNVVTGFIGATSGAFGASVVYPLNVLRTRLQTQGTALHPPTYAGIWDVAHRTLANEGWRGLYKGLTPNLLKVAPALSITWVVYENSKRLLGLP